MFKYYRELQMSQRKLSDETGIPIRSIQAYEIGTADIKLSLYRFQLTRLLTQPTREVSD